MTVPAPAAPAAPAASADSALTDSAPPAAPAQLTLRGVGVTLTACILAFALFQALSALGIVKRPLGALENNALTTVASGAGYMTGGGNMAAFGALLMVTTVRPSLLPMIAWFGVIAALGVFAAIPIKRQLI